ncbi:trans-2-enoyl-CoA reductase family protein [Erysipelothrix sp. HDW6C]|uniref:enoyl-ACP reductase FabV n=1 Tax=Erysipelothrix sp. HDW6C TaxID=2714930 RepID=UPI001408E3C3|nr:enoyl-ACP reductase FabV [Erysipelothrix sp. HDW6C]QIK69708.1 trans-2-enoyl-CoA reductase family protein [Erysipelothrix sp. HDW6C]
MTIKPMIRDNIALNAHPQGCKKNIKNQIQEVIHLPKITDKPLNVLIIGGSSGYGLATRIALAFNAGAFTYNVSFERAARGRNTASAGYYNNEYFQHFALEHGLQSYDLNGDAFSHEIKQTVIDDFKAMDRKIDLVVYSVASGIRIDPDTQEKFVSALKPIDTPFKGYSVDIAKETIREESVDIASFDDIRNTEKVMGGEDYKLWVEALLEADMLNQDCRVVTYTYIGSPITYAIYKDGTIGHAKRDLEHTNQQINALLKPLNGQAIISSSKTVVTKASVFIPTVALYASALFKVMKQQGTHESIIEHKYRLYHDMIYGDSPLIDDEGRYRLDAFELDDETQNNVNILMDAVTPDNFKEIVDFDAFRHEFLAINGFDIDGVNYDDII